MIPLTLYTPTDLSISSFTYNPTAGVFAYSVPNAGVICTGAFGFTFSAANGVSVVVTSCAADSIFHNGFEATP